MNTMEQFAAYAPTDWEKIPDFGLYMDQVITYIERENGRLPGCEGHQLTPSMINNYVKRGLLPRPLAKKYDRAQLALLIMITTLKRVASIDDIVCMTALKEGDSVQALYESFCQAQAESARNAARRLSEDGASALRFATEAAACAMASEALLKR